MNTPNTFTLYRKRLIAALLIALLLGSLACQSLEEFQQAVTNLQSTQVVPNIEVP